MTFNGGNWFTGTDGVTTITGNVNMSATDLYMGKPIWNYSTLTIIGNLSMVNGSDYLFDVSAIKPGMPGQSDLVKATTITVNSSDNFYCYTEGGIGGDTSKWFYTVMQTTNPTGFSGQFGNGFYKKSGQVWGDSYRNMEFDIVGLTMVQNIGNIHGNVFDDTNDSGIANTNDPSMPGVTVDLYDGNGDLVAVTQTDGNGNYSFLNMPTGNYSITFSVGGSGHFSPAEQGWNQDLASDVTIDNSTPGNITGSTGVFTLGGGGTATYNAGIFMGSNIASIGGNIFNDTNGDGFRNDNAGGVAGVTVELLDGNGNVIESTLTDQGGNYSFMNLTAGTYQIAVVYGSNYNASPWTPDSPFTAATGISYSDQIDLSFDEVVTEDAGLTAVA